MGKKIFRTKPPRRDTTVRLLPLHLLVFNGRKRAASASVSALRDLCECDHEINYHNSESLFDRIKRFADEGIGHGRVPRGTTGKHDRSPNGPAAMKVNPIV